MSKFYPGQLVRFNLVGRDRCVEEDEVSKTDVALVVAIKVKNYGNLLMVLFNGKLDEYHDGWFVKL